MKKYIRQDEQGVAHVLLVLLVVVVLAVVGFAGWRVVKNNKDKNKTSSTTATTTTSSKTTVAATQAACMTKYHDKDLCSFQAAQSATPLDKMSYTATLAVTQDGTTSTLVYAQDGKGNSKLTTQGGGAAMNSIMLNGATYVETDGTWVKYPSGAPAAPASDNPSDNLSFADSLDKTQFTKLGTEACGSLTCIKYQIKDSVMANATQFAWIDTKSHLLREWRATTADSTTDMKMTYEKVTISMPSPVRDYSTGVTQ